MVEGARLESVYTVYRRIEGSNPSLSANNKSRGVPGDTKPRIFRGFFFSIDAVCPRLSRKIVGQNVG